MNCPKCNGLMHGPRYRRLGWGGEVLTYRCDCGYSEDKPTADAKDANNEEVSFARGRAR